MSNAPSEHPNSNDPKVVHQYDDIQEYDNHLPNWWLYSLYGTVVFAIGYWFWFHVFASGEMPAQTLRREMAEDKARRGEVVTLSVGDIEALAKNAGIVNDGKLVFTQTCAPCHGPGGGGIIGPNLTDSQWIHGGGADKIFTTVRDGVPTKGMPAWGPQLGDTKTQAVTAFLLTIRNTNVPGGKAPQGEADVSTAAK